jgi:hypothetical protein
VIEEALRNLTAKRPQFLCGLKSLLDDITVSSSFFEGLSVSLPQEDVPVLAGAIGSKSEYLWTGDKRHFGDMYGKNIHGVRIVSSTMPADILHR